MPTLLEADNIALACLLNRPARVPTRTRNIATGQSCVIYGLRDPRNNLLRYVGRASSVRLRFIQHLYSKSCTNKRLKLWLQELEGLGLRPKLEILVRHRRGMDMVKREFRVMNQYSGLLNDQGYYRS